jgi:tetratricopeptide (TPR) repeat protein
MPNITVFLSAVSSEFHKNDPKNPTGFQSYRDVVAKGLRLLGSGYSVIVQEDLAQGFGNLLETLDLEVEKSDIIVHLVGYMAGSCPDEENKIELKELHERRPNLLANQPELANAIGDGTGISYTQWELYLGYHHRRKPLVFLANEKAPRSPFCSTRTMEESQATHWMRIREKTRKHCLSFYNQDNLAMLVVASIARYGLAQEAGVQPPTNEVIQAAKEETADIVHHIAEEIRKPSKPLKQPDSSGIQTWLQAVDTAALKKELDRRTTLELVDNHKEKLWDAIETEPHSGNLRDLALAEMAMGNYPQAMALAQQGADLSAKLLKTEPEQDERHRDDVINAYLLLHDAAKAAGQREEAIAALKKGSPFIDKEREPVRWADYHELLAEYLLDLANYEEAKKLIDDITDIREDYQPDTAELANSLLLWCKLLGAIAITVDDFRPRIGVAKRAQGIFTRQVPPNFVGAQGSMTIQGISYEKLGEFSKAADLHRGALKIVERLDGPNDSKNAVNLSNLALVYLNTRDLDVAECLMRRALEIGLQYFGPEDRISARNFNNLATILKFKGRLREAEYLYRFSLAMSEKIYGVIHPDISDILWMMADLMIIRGRSAEAEWLFRHGIKIFKILEESGRKGMSFSQAVNLYYSHLVEMNYSQEEALKHILSAMKDSQPLGPLTPEIVKMLGPSISVEEALQGLNTQYKSENKPPIWFLPLTVAISPYLDEWLGPIEKEHSYTFG